MAYEITARLDEPAGVLAGDERIRYTNHSPDTLQTFALHLHLNAFRPGSRWSDADSVEGTRRFNDLKDPDYGFNHVRDVRIMGRPVEPIYPFAPDSTIVRFPLPRSLPRVPAGLQLPTGVLMAGLPRLYYRTHQSRGGRVPAVPYRVEKPWGYELIWARTDRYVGKMLHVRAGHVLSLQYHNEKDETMHLLRGELILRTQPGPTLEERRFQAGESVRIPPKLIHQIEAVVDSDVLEASTPELDDLVRLQDRYGRG